MSKNLIQILPCHYTSDYIEDKSSNPNPLRKKRTLSLEKNRSIRSLKKAVMPITRTYKTDISSNAAHICSRWSACELAAYHIR